MNLDAEYKKYVEHWGDPIDPINYKLYSIETNMPYFHPDNRLFTKEEFREQLEKVSPQDPEHYSSREITVEDIHKIHKEMMDKEERLISTSDNTTELTSEVRNGITIHQSKPKKDI